MAPLTAYSGRRPEVTWLSLALILLVSGCCSPPRFQGLGVTIEPQDRDWWCWAATTEQIARFYGTEAPQCESADFVHGTPPNCCQGCAGDCDCWGSAWGATISDIQNNWNHWGFDYDYVSDELSWDDFKETISSTRYCGKSPIQVVWWWTNGGGHVVTAYGYGDVGSTRWVSYYNPLPMSCVKSNNQCSPSAPAGEDAVSTYAAFVTSGGHIWGDSFYNFKSN